MARFILSAFTRLFARPCHEIVPIPADVVQRMAWTEIANG